MLRIDCPFCGPRAEVEFRYAGQAHVMRGDHPATASDDDWQAFLYTRANPLGEHRERWRHIHGCGQFFNAVRHTRSDRFVATYRIGETPPESVS